MRTDSLTQLRRLAIAAQGHLERRDGLLDVKTFHVEPGVRRSRALDDACNRALDRLRCTVGLERVVR